MVTDQLVMKYFRQAVKRNKTAHIELKRAALSSTEIQSKLKSDVAREIHLLKIKHKMAATPEDVEFMVSSYVELYLGLATAKAAQSEWQNRKAREAGTLKAGQIDDRGLDPYGNGTVKLEDGTEVKINDKKESKNGGAH